MKKMKTFNRDLEVGSGERANFYEVFARTDSSDPLTHIGSVEAPNDDLAQVRAWYVYDQHKWAEMCVVPTNSIVTVTESGKSIKIKAI